MIHKRLIRQYYHINIVVVSILRDKYNCLFLLNARENSEKGAE
jgi:hypothetical protein